jgi:hypothetical protein
LIENGKYGGHVEMVAINEIYEVSVTVYFMSEDHISPQPSVITGRVITERNASFLFAVNLIMAVVLRFQLRNKEVLYY